MKHRRSQCITKWLLCAARLYKGRDDTTLREVLFADMKNLLVLGAYQMPYSNMPTRNVKLAGRKVDRVGVYSHEDVFGQLDRGRKLW
jgi:hypothetical protein